MSAWPEPASYQDPLPQTMKYCKICGKQTPHQLRSGPGLATSICTACLKRALSYEQDRD
jgi:hypothetical protein